MKEMSELTREMSESTRETVMGVTTRKEPILSGLVWNIGHDQSPDECEQLLQILRKYCDVFANDAAELWCSHCQAPN